MQSSEIQVSVEGRVQGIRFRKLVKDKADLMEFKGYVMNRDDGSVYIVVQGLKKKLSEFVTWLENNPGLSNIVRMDVRKQKIEKEYPDFRIIKTRSYISDKAQSVINLGRNFLGVKSIPSHVAIIPDGNRRWAKHKGWDGTFGHYKAGAYGNLEALFKEGRKLGVKYISIWGFSTENWKRSKKEQEEIFNLIQSGCEKFMKDAHVNKIRFRHIGRKDRLPVKLRESLDKLEKRTEKYEEFCVQLCLDYGGRDEILRAVNSIIKDGKSVSENEFSNLLDTKGLPDPDLIIRTSGEKRISGLFPWQSVYSEFYFSDLHFPDFGPKEFSEAIKEYGRRQRRFGGN